MGKTLRTVKDLGKFIRRARYENEWTLKDLAERIHQPRALGNISKLEKGLYKQGPTFVTFAAILDVLGYEIQVVKK